MEKKTVIKFFGTQDKAADFIGKSQQLISRWPDPIPPEWALYFDEATQGQLEFDKKYYQNGPALTGQNND
ncbi:hypothetical protein LCGC14_1624030 [marine sediment metagenome]|uniref:Uncharacterized protein n=1 Tax=marine sediment metagenome TaxID=412755 RepID=A0A0F9IRQ3_9ZZZZ